VRCSDATQHTTRGGAAAAAAGSIANLVAPSAAATSSAHRPSLGSVGAAAAASANGADGGVASAALSSAAESDWRFYELRPSVLQQEAYKYVLTPKSAPVFNKFSAAELDALVGEVMKFLLLRASARQVTRHAEILAVMRERAKGGANQVMADARRRFMTLYGYDLKTIERKADADPLPAQHAGAKRKSAADAASASAGTKSYVLTMPAAMASSPGLARAYNFGCALTEDGDGAADGGAVAGASPSPPPPPSLRSAEAVQGLLLFVLSLVAMEERRSRSGAAAAQAGGGGGGGGCTVRRLWSLLRKADASMTREQVRTRQTKQFASLWGMVRVCFNSHSFLFSPCSCFHLFGMQKNHAEFGNVQEVIDSFISQQSVGHHTPLPVARDATVLSCVVSFPSPVFPLCPSVSAVPCSYLDRVKLPVREDVLPGDDYALRIGARALAEIDAQTLYESMCEDMMGVEPDAAYIKQMERDAEIKAGTRMQTLPKPAANAAAAR
jgi:hypothetical protein